MNGGAGLEEEVCAVIARATRFKDVLRRVEALEAQAAADEDKPLEFEWVEGGRSSWENGSWRARAGSDLLRTFPAEDRPGQWCWRTDSTFGYAPTREAAQAAAEAAYREWRAAQEPSSADDGFAALEWRPDLLGALVARPESHVNLYIIRSNDVAGLWEASAFVNVRKVGQIPARTEAEAKRAAYDAWRAFEALRREVAGDA